MACKQKTRVFKKAQVFSKNPTFHQKLRLYLIWKWTGLFKRPVFSSKTPSLPYMEVDRCFQKTGLFIKNSVITLYGSGLVFSVFQKTGLFIKNSVFTLYGSGPVFQKRPVFSSKTPVFNTKFLVFFLVF